MAISQLLSTGIDVDLIQRMFRRKPQDLEDLCQRSRTSPYDSTTDRIRTSRPAIYRHGQPTQAMPGLGSAYWQSTQAHRMEEPPLITQHFRLHNIFDQSEATPVPQLLHLLHKWSKSLFQPAVLHVQSPLAGGTYGHGGHTQSRQDSSHKQQTSRST